MTDVAMVIITTMVAKIYFPESLERGVAVPQARTFNYRMAENDDYYGSDADDPSEGEAKSDDDADDDNEILASDEDDEEIAAAGATDDDNNTSESNDLLSEMRPSQTPVSGLRPGVSYGNNRILEFEQLTMSKTQVLRRLVTCIVMLNVTFVTWGVLQVM